MTQPAQPVHSPEVTTSEKSSFHWAVQRSRLAGAAVGSATDMGGHATDQAARTPKVGRTGSTGAAGPLDAVGGPRSVHQGRDGAHLGADLLAGVGVAAQR